MTSYEEFLEQKRFTPKVAGLTDIPPLNPQMFPHQTDVTTWALRLGRSAAFLGTGLGKSLIELDWARIVTEHTGMPVLFLAPLSVARQMIGEGVKFGIAAKYCRDSSEIGDASIIVTNYERMDNFNEDEFAGVVLDESSCLKATTGVTRTRLIEKFRDTPYKLCGSATPSPNDHMELGNHAEFLGVMTATEMLSMFFVHDGGETQKWRLKGHARKEFWKWVCSWAVNLRRPSDIGHSDEKFVLPPLIYHEHIVDVDTPSEGMLFAMPAESLSERLAARRSTVADRVKKVVEIVNADPDETWLIWTNLNKESEAISSALAGAIEVTGSDNPDFKADTALAFAEGKIGRMISKSAIFGWGSNWQVCSHMIHAGVTDSFESFFQSVRRCWRFGQTKPVHCHIIAASTEGNVLDNLKRKEREAEEMAEEMLENMLDMTRMNLTGTTRTEVSYERQVKKTENWEMHLSDCVDLASEIPTDSIHYSVTSLPFDSLYTYSASDRDMGNSKNSDEFWDHYKFLIDEERRIMMPGRLISVHCMNMPTSKTRDGVIGIRDFRGEIIRAYCGSEAATLYDARKVLDRLGYDTTEIDAALKDASLRNGGFIYHSEVCIWKDPVTAMQRTKAIGLLHKQICKDSCMSRQGVPEYLITFRKPGDNPERVDGLLEDYYGADGTGPSGESTRTIIDEDTGKPIAIALPSTKEVRRSIEIWQRYASPVWMDINPSDTLQYRSAREHADERHICPLALTVIRRGIQLWSKPGDLVHDPFTGIGSTGVVALEMGRRFIGSELKKSYFEQSVRNLGNALSASRGLFAGVAESQDDPSEELDTANEPEPVPAETSASDW